MKFFTSNLKYLINKNDVKDIDIADMLGISKGYFSQIKNGKIIDIKHIYIDKISDYFNVNEQSLLYDDLTKSDVTVKSNQDNEQINKYETKFDERNISDPEYHFTVVSKFYKFIMLNYGNVKRFCKIVKLNENELIASVNNGIYREVTLERYNKGGGSVDWLLEDNDDVTAMFADNPAGVRLRNKFQKYCEKLKDIDEDDIPELFKINKRKNL